SNDKNELLLFELESKKLFAFEVPFLAGQVDDYKIVSTDSIFFLQKRTSVVYLTHSNSTDDSIKKFEIINEYELQSILDSIFDEEMYLSCYSPLYPLDYKDGRLFLFAFHASPVGSSENEKLNSVFNKKKEIIYELSN